MTYILLYVDEIILINSSHAYANLSWWFLPSSLLWKICDHWAIFWVLQWLYMQMVFFLVKVPMPTILLLELAWPNANLLLLQLTPNTSSIPLPTPHMMIIHYIRVMLMLCSISHLLVLTSLMLSSMCVFTCMLSAPSPCLHWNISYVMFRALYNMVCIFILLRLRSLFHTQMLTGVDVRTPVDLLMVIVFFYEQPNFMVFQKTTHTFLFQCRGWVLRRC